MESITTAYNSYNILYGVCTQSDHVQVRVIVFAINFNGKSNILQEQPMIKEITIINTVVNAMLLWAA